jgi:MSHA biogenesis protein MshO
MRCHDGDTMSRFQRGFTLIEAVIVIALTGIIAAMVAVFIREPVQGYFDTVRRAELTDVADTAARRISRDLHLALPNSVRSSNPLAIEFLLTRTGGRYRAELDTGTEDILDFTAADSSFDLLGPPVTFAAGDQVVVYNLGISGADAYEGNSASTHNRRPYAGAVGAPLSNVAITSANALPFASPGNRFQVVDGPVSYVCDLGAGTLRRYSGYAIVPAQAIPPVGGSSALLAKNVSGCSFTYQAGVTQRSGLVAIQLALTQDGETVSLHHEVHVSNVP